jgi:hypothetical protein
VTTKYIATAVSAVCGTGAAIAGTTAGASGGHGDAPGLRSPASRVPLPRHPAAAVAPIGQIMCARLRARGLQATDARCASKGKLIEGGHGMAGARITDFEGQQAVAGTGAQQAFTVTNIAGCTAI